MEQGDFAMDLDGEEAVGAGGRFIHIGLADHAGELSLLHDVEHIGCRVYLFFGQSSERSQIKFTIRKST